MSHSLRRALTPAVLSLVLTTSTLLAGSPAHAADRDCGDFSTQREAQLFFLDAGGPGSDPHELDADGDGIACETLDGPYYYGTGSGGTTTTQTTLRQRARVLWVVDGDTLKVRLANGRRKTVRLIGIDTPEVYGTVECGGKAASASMRRLTPRGTRVVLVSDPTQDRVDRYGRILRYVMKAGRDMNRTQVARGWARVYVYNHNPFKRVSAYRWSQRRAQEADRGIWGLCR